MSEPFLAEIRIFPYNFAPRGWGFCNGQLLPIAQNTALFSLVGTTYGGNGVTTFGLPNLQGRVPVGFGQGPGLRDYDLGETGGSETVTLTSQNLPMHTHTLMAASDPPTESTPSDTRVLAGSTIYAPAANLVPMAQAGGAGQPHQNMQPFLTLHFCIALQGIFPLRP